MLRRLLTTCLVAVVLAACGGTDEVEQVSVHPHTIRLTDAPGRDNRHDFHVTGPSYGDPHRLVGDEIWRTDGSYIVQDGRLVTSGLDEPAPYTQGTPMVVEAEMQWRGQGQAPQAVQVEVLATLRSTADPDAAPITVLSAEPVTLAAVDTERSDGGATVAFEAHRWQTAELPARIDLYRLELDWRMAPVVDGEPIEEVQQVRTEHLIPLSWRGPTADAPVYRRTALWAASWAAGRWPATPAAERDASWHAISVALMEGLRTLDRAGYEYGTFARPPLDEVDDRADLFLDFKRSACGEFRGILMALIEFHGIDAGWKWLKFTRLGSQTLSVYKTRKLSAVGREAKHWYNIDHIIVSVNGRVYDPTYTVWKPSFEAYEDWMFGSYCYGFDTPCDDMGDWCYHAPPDASRCVPNPPGFADGWDFELLEGTSHQ